MSVLICSTKYGGCGHVGDASEWTNADHTGDWIICPKCLEDHAFQITEENIHSLTNNDNFAKALKLLYKGAVA